MLDPQQTVANAILDHSECAAIFQQHRIDFCCRGDLTIEAAAKERGLDVGALLQELDSAVAERRGDRPGDPRQLSTPQLITHIVSKHHEYLRKAIPFVRALGAKVSRVHGDHNPKLRELEVAIEELSEALLPHLDEEEQALFPVLTAREPDVAQTNKLLASMVEDHHAVAHLLERIRAASEEFALPDWACNSYRALFSELRDMESDIFAHVHLENHVLKPRFAAA